MQKFGMDQFLFIWFLIPWPLALLIGFGGSHSARESIGLWMVIYYIGGLFLMAIGAFIRSLVSSSDSKEKNSEGQKEKYSYPEDGPKEWGVMVLWLGVFLVVILMAAQFN